MKTDFKEKELLSKLGWVSLSKTALLAFAIIIGGYGIIFSNYAELDQRTSSASTYYMEHYLPIVAVLILLSFLLGLFNFYSLLGWMKNIEIASEDQKLEDKIQKILLENKVNLEKQEFEHIKNRVKEEKQSKKTKSKLYL